jgi:hypothetical protein
MIQFFIIQKGILYLIHSIKNMNHVIWGALKKLTKMGGDIETIEEVVISNTLMNYLELRLVMYGTTLCLFNNLLHHLR